jgi:aminoglycoside-2''-adenylyltransferase
MASPPVDQDIRPEARSFYCRALAALQAAEIPFLVGGAYAFAHYTGIARHTKDFDIFVRRRDVEPVLDVFSAAGYQTELTFPSWLAKAICETDSIDIIFNSSNGITPVDDAWFEHSIRADILGMRLPICPAEEVIWSKSFVMSRERYDGADVAHLLHAQAGRLDWHRMLQRFDERWRVLLAHLILFGFIYPGERDRIPSWVQHQLMGRLQDELSEPPATDRVCHGPLLSWDQYLVDVEGGGYTDGRLIPWGTLSAEDCAHTTAVLKGEKQAEAAKRAEDAGSPEQK